MRLLGLLWGNGFPEHGVRRQYKSGNNMKVLSCYSPNCRGAESWQYLCNVHSQQNFTTSQFLSSVKKMPSNSGHATSALPRTTQEWERKELIEGKLVLSFPGNTEFGFSRAHWRPVTARPNGWRKHLRETNLKSECSTYVSYTAKGRGAWLQWEYSCPAVCSHLAKLQLSRDSNTDTNVLS